MIQVSVYISELFINTLVIINLVLTGRTCDDTKDEQHGRLKIPKVVPREPVLVCHIAQHARWDGISESF